MHTTTLGLDVRGPNTANGTNIQLYDFHGGNAQRFGFVHTGNGIYRILTAVTSGEKGVTVQNNSSADGANVYQYQFTSEYLTDYWTLENTSQVAELTVFSLPNGSHAWITVKNNLKAPIMLDAFSVASNKEVSVGTWGNQLAHIGIWFNIESYYADDDGYVGRVSLTQTISIDQFNTINNYIKNNDGWGLYNNCSNFAANIWNSVSSNDLKFLIWPTPLELSNEIKSKTGYQTNRQYEKTLGNDVGYKNAETNAMCFVDPNTLGSSTSLS